MAGRASDGDTSRGSGASVAAAACDEAHVVASRVAVSHAAQLDPWMQSADSWAWAFTSRGSYVQPSEGHDGTTRARYPGDPLLWDSSIGSTTGGATAHLAVLRRWHLWEGRATFLCDGRLMLGPDIGNMVVTLFMITIPCALVAFLT